jgi:hypothetical protein
MLLVLMFMAFLITVDVEPAVRPLWCKFMQPGVRWLFYNLAPHGSLAGRTNTVLTCLTYTKDLISDTLKRFSTHTDTPAHTRARARAPSSVSFSFVFPFAVPLLSLPLFQSSPSLCEAAHEHAIVSSSLTPPRLQKLENNTPRTCES